MIRKEYQPAIITHTFTESTNSCQGPNKSRKELTFILFILFYYYYYFWLHWVLVAAHGIFCCGTRGVLFSCGTQAPEGVGSVVVAHGLFSCGMRAQQPCDMWDLSSLTRDRTHVPYIGRRILNCWATREVPRVNIY